MKLAEVDWSVLRGGLIMLVISAVIGIGALAASHRFWSMHHTVLTRERTALLATRGQYHALDEEEDIIATYLPRYVELENGGIIGREQRLDWIDVLRESARDAKVPRLEYTIAAQERFDPGFKLNIGDYGVYSTSMRLKLGLLHEGDLLELLDRFRASVAGLFGVTGCSMMRADHELRMAPDASNVEATCELNFITLRDPSLAGAGS
jgi:hypothetical protein